MHSFDATFHRLLVTAVEEQLQNQRMTITDRPARSFEMYMQYVGRIEGLRMALSIAEEVEKRLQGGASG